MSFYFDKAATPADMCKAIEADRNLPLSVKSFLYQAIAGLTQAPGNAEATKAHLRPDDIVVVKCTGHLCDGPTSSGLSNAQLEVRPVTVTA